MKVAVLDNLRSVHNVGSIFRTCNASSIEKIYLTGTTPTPLDHKGNRRKDFSKVALGAEDLVAWEYCEDVVSCVKKLQKENFYIISLEQDIHSTDYKNITIPKGKEVAFIVGAEVDGINHEVIKLSDVIAEIPMLGTKESLNVTIAFGIGVYRILGI